MLFVCAASQLLFAVQWERRPGDWPTRVTLFASFPVMVNLAAVFFMMPVSLFLGGLMAARQRPSIDASGPLRTA